MWYYIVDLRKFKEIGFNKILGIVSEYNPFHNGHIVHLRQSIESTQSQFVIAVMSGNFIQRGDTAIVDKWTRAEMALRQGVDLVIELPTVYATSSAENFAYGAIKILDSIGIVDYVSFGSECGNINLMADIADVLNDEPQEYSQLLHDQLQLGRSFPSAREIAINEYFLGNTTYTNILKSPNNILGIEYIKALKALDSSIIPITIRRNYVDYNSTSPDLEKGIASASAIRTMIQNGKSIRKVVPQTTYDLIKQKAKLGQLVSGIGHYSNQIIYNLRKMSLDEIANLADVSEGLENVIKLASMRTSNVYEAISMIKSKRYTQSRIQRIMLYSLLGITKKDIELSKKVTPYIRILGFTSKGKRLISAISDANPKLNIIISVKKFVDSNNNKNLHSLLSKDIFATNVYTTAFESEGYGNIDFTKKIIQIDD